jgi:hypothetical protein
VRVSPHEKIDQNGIDAPRSRNQSRSTKSRIQLARQQLLIEHCGRAQPGGNRGIRPTLVGLWYGQSRRYRRRSVTFEARKGAATLSKVWVMRSLSVGMIIVTGALMFGCSQKHEIWITTQQTPVYASNGESGNEPVLFVLDVGDACTPIREVIMKSYLHTEIQCKRGRGWVIEKQNFEVKQGRPDT